jgi:hypothetical protein
MAEEAFEAAYSLMSMIDNVNDAPGPEQANAWPGDVGDVVAIPPMHPRGRR